ncbi:hypothetical protein [Prosthecobacter dejongeii]|uniref:Uncharacterized protein n=1 Tax=Prosthecobacter dejongeii TaxID=48465 RepID=A0A7W7YNI1_9BACT|nr:hypothetical protein [Prosthecobacter dejongeii]MBB5039329.1 hypothetical protein [Prosthecobacter dejongeii]
MNSSYREKHIVNLVGQYPSCQHLKLFIENGRGEEVKSFIRLWMKEGIPYAFKEFPFLYQQCREWIADQVKVKPHEISLVGSGRFGYSLKSKDFRIFGEKSDLDFLIVSESKFNECVEASNLFIKDVESGKLFTHNPALQNERTEDIKYIKNNIPKGFIQSGKVPTLYKYTATQKLEDIFDQISSILHSIKIFPNFTKASYRVYRDQCSMERQLTQNLRSALK